MTVNEISNTFVYYIVFHYDLDLLPPVTPNPLFLNTQITKKNYDEVVIPYNSPSFFRTSRRKDITLTYMDLYIKQCSDVLRVSPMFHRCLRTEPTPPPLPPLIPIIDPGRYSFIHLIILLWHISYLNYIFIVKIYLKTNIFFLIRPIYLYNTNIPGVYTRGGEWKWRSRPRTPVHRSLYRQLNCCPRQLPFNNYRS